MDQNSRRWGLFDRHVGFDKLNDQANARHRSTHLRDGTVAG
jgi:hypothetical protein